jgi:hypothetical protein
MSSNGKSSAVLVAILTTSLFVGNALAADPYDNIVIADAHLHLLDFLQNSDYLENGKLVPKFPGVALPSGQRGKRIEAVLWAMKEANVSHAMLTGMPFLKKWSEDESFRSGYYLDSSSRVVRARDTDYVLALSIQDFANAHGEDGKEQLKKIYPFISGFDGTDLGAVDMITKRVKEFPGIFRGVGEVMSRHDDLTNLTTGERPRANHPALFRIFDFAGMHDLPVSIHHNISPISPSGQEKEPLYLAELLDAFREFPDTRFIWCHAGISRRIRVKNLPHILDGVLSEHKKHVFIDLSWVILPDYVFKDLEEWVDLIEKYPENFMAGSDAVGSFGDYKEEIRAYNKLFKSLKEKTTVELVARGNFIRVMRKTGLTLDADYMYPETKYIKRTPPKP